MPDFYMLKYGYLKGCANKIVFLEVTPIDSTLRISPQQLSNLLL